MYVPHRRETRNDDLNSLLAQKLPTLIIPFHRSSDFMLVYPHAIYIFEKILSGAGDRRPIVLPFGEEPREAGSSRRVPLLTSWARPARNADRPQECLYLGREDGVVHYLQISDHRGGDTSRAGRFECNIDKAFAHLDIGLRSPDILISGGDLSVGELYSVSPVRQSRQHYRNNW